MNLPPSPLDQAVQQGGMEAIKPTVNVLQKTVEGLGLPAGPTAARDFMGPLGMRRGTGKATEPGILLPAESQSATASGSEGAFGESSQGLGSTALEFLKNALTLPLGLAAGVLQNPMNALQGTLGAVLHGGTPGWVGQADMVRKAQEQNRQRMLGEAEYQIAALRESDPAMAKAMEPLLAGPLRAIQQVGGESAGGREGISTLEGITTRHPWVGELFNRSWQDQQLANLDAALAARNDARTLSDTIAKIQAAPKEKLEMRKLEGQANYESARGQYQDDLMRSQVAENAAQAAAAGRSNLPGGGAPLSGERQYKDMIYAEMISAAQAGNSARVKELQGMLAAAPAVDPLLDLKGEDIRSRIEARSKTDPLADLRAEDIRSRIEARGRGNETDPSLVLGRAGRLAKDFGAEAGNLALDGSEIPASFKDPSWLGRIFKSNPALVSGSQPVAAGDYESMSQSELKAAYRASAKGSKERAEIEAVAKRKNWM